MGVIFVAMARIHSLLESANLARRLYVMNERQFINANSNYERTCVDYTVVIKRNLPIGSV
jgi:hypothetical protein